MLKLLANILKWKKRGASRGKGAPLNGDVLADESAPIFEGLAMTEELRDALFPKTPQMVSAIFDRPPPLTRQSQPSPSQSPASGGDSFPIVF